MFNWFKKKEEITGIQVSKDMDDYMKAHQWIWSKKGGLPIMHIVMFHSDNLRNKLYDNYYILNPKTNRWEDRSNNV